MQKVMAEELEGGESKHVRPQVQQKYEGSKTVTSVQREKPQTNVVGELKGGMSQPIQREHTHKTLVGDFARAGMGGAIASTPTTVMRTELAEAGVELPGEEELTVLSKRFGEWIEQYRRDNRKGPTHSWHALFKEIDRDGSGDVTFDELRDVVRNMLHKGPSVVSEDALKAMWCVLDVDSSNELEGAEMARFFKLAM